MTLLWALIVLNCLNVLVARLSDGGSPRFIPSDEYQSLLRSSGHFKRLPPLEKADYDDPDPDRLEVLMPQLDESANPTNATPAAEVPAGQVESSVKSSANIPDISAPTVKSEIDKRVPGHDFGPVEVDTPPKRDPNTKELKIKRSFWPADTGSGAVAWFFAALFICAVGSVPWILHSFGRNGKLTKTVLYQGICLIVWLIGGLYLFTHHIHFRSIHFGKIVDGQFVDEFRTLTLVEAVYLFSQIITTVGYGDITPAYTVGKMFIGFFVLCAIIVIAGMVSEMSSILVERAEGRVFGTPREGDSSRSTPRVKEGPSIKPFLEAFGAFTVCIVAGMLFFCLWPGEEKSWTQGLYMAIITLTTVGFGVVTPETEAGMTFAAFWMIIGVAALGTVVGSFTEFIMMRKKVENQDLFREMKRKRMQERNSEKHIVEDPGETALLVEYSNEDGEMDKLSYICYCLLKDKKINKNEVQRLILQFEALDLEDSGAVGIEEVANATADNTARSGTGTTGD